MFNPFQVNAFDPTTGSFTASTTEIVVTAGDRKGILISGVTVNVRTNWGFLSASSCVTDSNGQCSVTWSTADSSLAPRDCSIVDCATTTATLSRRATVVVYTTGEEAFNDNNDNGSFDDTETFTDLEEPFFERSSVGSTSTPIYTSTLDPVLGEPIDKIINFTGWAGDTLNHDGGDGEYNGASCTHGTLCSSQTSTIIWDVSYIDLTEEP